MRRLDEIIAAATLLTRLPVSRLAGARPWPEAARTVWAYPLIGAAIGAAGGFVLMAASRLGLPPGLAALLAIAAQLTLTGGLHEDGLADAADGLGARGDAARKLAVMRDSRIGTFGTLALVMAVAIRATALASLPPPDAALALMAAGGLGRGAMVGVLAMLPPARAGGLGASLGRPRPFAAIAIAAASAVLLGLGRAVLAIAIAALAAIAVARIARRQIGGQTGDVLGATSVIAECLVLCVASRAGP